MLNAQLQAQDIALITTVVKDAHIVGPPICTVPTSTPVATPVPASPPAYLQFRFKTNAIRGSIQQYVAIQEFRFFDIAGQPITPASATNPGGSNVNGAHVPEYLIDGIFWPDVTGTKWLDANWNQAQAHVIFQFGSVAKVASYEWVTCEDHSERDPVSWKIEARVGTSGEWTLIQSISNNPTAQARNTVVGPFQIWPPAYLQFRFKTGAIRVPDQAYVAMQEFRFFDIAGQPITPASATNPGGSNVNGAHEARFLIDGIVNPTTGSSKWLDLNKGNVIFEFGSVARVMSYEWVTCEDEPPRDPVSWQIEARVGTNDAWTLLQNISNNPTTQARNTVVGPFQI